MLKIMWENNVMSLLKTSCGDVNRMNTMNTISTKFTVNYLILIIFPVKY